MGSKAPQPPPPESIGVTQPTSPPPPRVPTEQKKAAVAAPIRELVKKCDEIAQLTSERDTLQARIAELEAENAGWSKRYELLLIDRSNLREAIDDATHRLSELVDVPDGQSNIHRVVGLVAREVAKLRSGAAFKGEEIREGIDLPSGLYWEAHDFPKGIYLRWNTTNAVNDGRYKCFRYTGPAALLSDKPRGELKNSDNTLKKPAEKFKADDPPENATPLPDWLQEVVAEIERAVAKFPMWPNHVLHAASVVAEEAGEIHKETLQAIYEQSATREDVRKEAIQTAAMAIRFFRSIDRYDWSPCEQHTQEFPELAARLEA